MHRAELGPYAAAVERALADLASRDAVRRIWGKDARLWKSEPEHQDVIRNSLGWLGVTALVRAHKADLARFAVEVGQAGFTDILLLGMGGSSLCADVLRLTFGPIRDHPRLSVLDTTDPASIRALEAALDLRRTLFIVASKSGTTPEIAAFHRYFFQRAAALRPDRAGEQFAAITDPGTALERVGVESAFRRVFLNPSDIGGRYSALSYFGMVPATLMGVDALQLLERADRMAVACGAATPAAQNPGLTLGAALGALARAGRDKVTFVCAPEIASFGYWVEQLIAESTGKEGVGILPVEGEALGPPEVYGSDRVFVHLTLHGITHPAAARLEPLARAGHPLLTIALADRDDVGAEFFRWEFATAVAGAVLGIDPFDQPNVQESKDNTKRLLGEFQASGRLPEGEPLARFGSIQLFAQSPTAAVVRSAGSLRDALQAHLDQLGPGDYAALTAYLQATPEHAAALDRIRLAIRDRHRVATTLGYGPRFLHSTGQLHKGGPANGLFLQFTAAEEADLPIPDEPHTFGTMKAAQALGDLQSLQSRRRRALRIHIAGSIREGLRQVEQAVRAH